MLISGDDFCLALLWRLTTWKVKGEGYVAAAWTTFTRSKGMRSPSTTNSAAKISAQDFGSLVPMTAT
jgi:hypothetical protein